MKPENVLETRWSLLSRLKDWGDQQSWQDFFDTYRGLIYGVAIKAGLSDSEAKDAVQETLVTVAKNVSDLKRDSAYGSFKGWLLHTTRWKIADQFRKRRTGKEPEIIARDESATDVKTLETASYDLDASWDEEWQKHLLSVALEKVKQTASPEEVQIFDLCVLRNEPVKEVAARLKLKLWKVYFAQKRIAKLLQREIKQLELTGI